MKLILCKKCYDVIKLKPKVTSKCSCGKCFGAYIDELNAWYAGEHAVPIGFANSTLITAIQEQPQDGWGAYFEAFVIPKNCDTFKKREV